MDPDGTRKLAEYFSEMKDPEAVSNALLAMEPEKAVLILKSMKKQESAKVLAHFPEDAFEKTIEIMMTKKDDQQP